MKNPLKSTLLPWLTLGAGIWGLILRIWLFTSGVDGKGLLIDSHPANALSFIVCALFLGALVLCVSDLGHAPAYTMLFPEGKPILLGNCIAAVGLVATGFFELQTAEGLFGLAYFLITLLAAASLAYIGWSSYKKTSVSFVFHAAVTTFFMLGTPVAKFLFPIDRIHLSDAYRLPPHHPRRPFRQPVHLCTFQSGGAVLLPYEPAG